jgi:hypothetical protein
MADKKISELNSLTGANAADGDLVAIVDVSATETKKITRSEFFTDTPSIDVGGTVTATGLDMNGNADFGGNIGLSRAASTILYRTDDTGIVDIRSATASLSGPSIQLYAGSHASFPNHSFFFGDTMFFRPVDGSPEFMRFVDGTGAVFNETGADHDFRIESDTNTHAFFLQGSDGNVGIGTSSPAEKLEVTGNIILDATDANIKIKSGVTGTAGAVNFTFNSDSTVYGSLSLPYDTRSSVGLLVQSNNSYPMSIASGTSSSATNAVILSTSNEERMRVDYLGRVGIGDSAPPTILSVRGDTPESRITNTNTISDTIGTEEVARLGVYGQKNNVYGPAANIVFRQDASTWSFVDQYNKGTRIEFCTQDATATDTSETPRMVIDKDGRVGIGTSAPSSLLEIASNATSQTLPEIPTLRITNTDTTVTANDIVGSVEFFSKDASDPDAVTGFVRNIAQDAGVGFNLAFGTKAATIGSDATERMRITSSGNVGIGTDDPTDKLHLSQDSAFAIQMERTGGTPSVCEIANSGNLLNISQNVSGIAFLTGGTPTEKMRIHASGYVICPNGVTLGTAAGTYNAANTLDDYEEGTWEPEYSGQSGSPTIVYNIQEGYYTKVGNVVTVTGRISTTSTTGSFSGDIRLSNLPFTCKNVTDLGAGGGLVISASTDFAGNFPCGGFARDNAAIFTLRTRVDFASETVGMNNADMATGAGNNMSFCATYLTDQ